MKKLAVFLFVCFILSEPLYPSFERIQVGAREASMSGAYTAISDDAEGIWHNPAGLRLIRNVQIHSCYTELYGIGALPQSNFSFILPTLTAGTWGIAFSQFGSSDYKEKDIRIAFAAEPTPGLYCGAVIKNNSLTLGNGGGSASAVGYDFGCVANVSRKLRFAMTSVNFNNPTLGDTTEELDKMLNLGMLLRPFEHMSVSFDLQKPAYEDFNLLLGAEKLLSPVFSVRTGVAMQPFSLSYGCSMDWSLFSLRFASTKHSVLDRQYIFSMLINLGGSSQPARRKAMFKKDMSRKERFSGIVNINEADVRELSRVPGISSITAKKIIEYREKMGVYRSVKEIMNIYGMSRTKFNKFKNYLTIKGRSTTFQSFTDEEGSPAEESGQLSESQEATQLTEEAVESSSKRLDINQATVEELVKIPGVSFPVARNIVKIRERIGYFYSWDEVLRVPGVYKNILNALMDKTVLTAE